MKLFISYSYAHKHSSAGRRARLMNERFLKSSNWEIITSNLSTQSDSNVTIISSASSKFFTPISYKTSAIKLMIKKLVSFVLWPDRGLFWSFRAYKQIYSRLKSAPESSIKIAALAYPFSSILLGAVLKKKFSARTHFTAHFIDAFYLVNKGNGTSFIFRPLNYLCEKFVYQQADLIILNKAKKNEFIKNFPNFILKAKFVDELPGNLFSINSNVKERNRCFFAGSLYKNIRNPEEVLRLFCSLEEMLLVAAGNTNDCQSFFEKYTGSNLKHIGMINHQEMELEYSKSEFLINIDNQDQAQQPPGKIIEYMLLQKPIVNFYKGNSVSGGLLKEHSLKNISYIEIDLDADATENIKMLKSFFNSTEDSTEKLFQVEDSFKSLEKVYHDV